MYDYDVILSFITALTLTYFAIPSVIRVARVKNLTDVPGGRHIHEGVIPSLGGIAIFAGTIFSIVLWTPFGIYGGDLQYILCAFVIIFLVGAKDDLVPIDPLKKLIGQILAAAILVFKSDIRITGFHGFGFEWLEHLPYGVTALFSIFTIIVIINAFNLIDGINGLSGSIAGLICATFGIWFLNAGHYDMSIIAFSTAGAIIAFLKYNYTPAKIFMGDTGALIIGMVCSILAINFIEINANGEIFNNGVKRISSAPAVAFGVLIFPLFDTLRVFTLRTLDGRSPMSPDRNHIHHLLVDHILTNPKQNHMQATSILVLANAIFIVGSFYLSDKLNSISLLLLILLLAIGLTSILYYLAKSKGKNKKEGTSKTSSNNEETSLKISETKS